MGTHWDVRAARIEAGGTADEARARADAIRADSELKLAESRHDLAVKQAAESREAERLKRAERDARRREKREQKTRDKNVKRQRNRARRAAAASALRRNAPRLVGVVAIGAPMLIAWKGQFKFGEDVMQLGPLAVLLPIATEGAVLYNAFLTHQAIEAGLPIGRYRLATWVTAAIAAAMNLWHWVAALATKDDAWAGLQVGVIYALASLLSIILWELTASLRQQHVAGKSGAELRQAAWRRLRFPRLSWAAASILAAHSCTTEQAWDAAWRDRYGVGPEASRRDRSIAKAILKAQRAADRKAAEEGRLSLINGVIVGRTSRVLHTGTVPLLSFPALTPPTVEVSVARVVPPLTALPVPGAPGRPTLRALPSAGATDDSAGVNPTHGATLGATHGATVGPTESATRRSGESQSRSRRSGGRSGESLHSDSQGRRRSSTVAAVESGRERTSVATDRSDGPAKRRSIEEHRTELRRLITAGDLPTTASGEEIRTTLGCAQKTALRLARELAEGA